MKDTYSDNERIENLLRKVHLPEPSPQLKARITAEAKKLWHQSSGELPGRILFWRLAVSAAAAVLIIGLANWSSDLAAGRWRSAKVLAAVEQPAGLDALPDLPSGPFIGRLASAARGSLHIDASSLSEHVQRVREFLDEIWQNGAPAPIGRSRLAPDKAGINLYS
jgi:hypothetical protein